MFQTVFFVGLWLLCALIPLATHADEGKAVVTNTAKTVDRWETSRIEALAAAGKHQYPQAETALQQLVQEAGESKATSPRLVVALKDLASVYASDKKFGDARVAYQRVLKIDEQKYGRESPMLITPLNDVIKVTCVTGKCYDTIPELKRLLTIRRKAHGTHSREVPVTLLLLGEAYEKHGDFVPAVGYFTQAVATERKISGEQSPMAAALAKNTERAKKELAEKQRKERELNQKLAAQKHLNEKHLNGKQVRDKQLQSNTNLSVNASRSRNSSRKTVAPTSKYSRIEVQQFVDGDNPTLHGHDFKVDQLK